MESIETLIFYLVIESLAISILICADGAVSDKKRTLIQYGNTALLRRKEIGLMQRHICFIGPVTAAASSSV